MKFIFYMQGMASNFFGVFWYVCIGKKIKKYFLYVTYFILPFKSPMPYLRFKNKFFKSMACGYSKLEALDADYNAKIRFQFR